jgi:hypothetical protein
LINDLSDKRLDALHGKENTFKNIVQFRASLIVLSVFLFSVIFGLQFSGKKYFLILWLIWIFFATFYSLKPVRLKERGKWGLIIVVFAQRLLPTLLVFSAFEYTDVLDIIIISIYILVRGFSSDLNHQIADYELDFNTATKTFAVSTGIKRAKQGLNYILEAEKILLLFILLRLVLKYPTLYSEGELLFILVLLVYGILWLLAESMVIKGYERNPFIHEEKNVFQFIHHPFPSIILPVVFCAFLLKYNLNYTFILIGLILNKKLFNIKIVADNFLSSYFIRTVLPWIKKIFKIS